MSKFDWNISEKGYMLMAIIKSQFDWNISDEDNILMAIMIKF